MSAIFRGLSVSLLLTTYTIINKEGREVANALMTIEPYWNKGYWVFDDASAGLDKEPFVRGIPDMIDDLVKDIPNADQGFRLVFSAQPFPGHQRYLTRVREELDGWWYQVEDGSSEGWLCPALFKYFKVAPEKIYVMAEPTSGKVQSPQSEEIARLQARLEKLEKQVIRLQIENEYLRKSI